ncbi:MAG: zinc-ribbon domain-containing protein [Anaerolineae bacterium]|nr:zinc-ribbon domain-containing protein [Anaerolineae bacterium]
MAYCPHCGASVRPTARFCGQCGRPRVPAEPLPVAVTEQQPWPTQPHIHIERSGRFVGTALSPFPQRDEQAVLGFRFEALPDWLNAPNVLGQSDIDKLAWALRNWQQFVANLWKWKGAAFTLRFLSQPNLGTIEVTLLARVRLEQQAQHVAQALATDLHAQLTALNFDPLPIATDRELQQARWPLNPVCLLEARQHEAIVPLNLGDAYVVYPYAQPAGDFRIVFETLLRTAHPTLLSLYVEPVELTLNEKTALSQAAATAQTLADFQYSGEYYQGRWQDPQAALVGEAYAEFLQRLGQPFLCVAHIAGEDVPSAWSVARALENGLGVTPTPPATLQRRMPIQCDIVQARTPQEMQAIHAAINHLSLVDWGTSVATPGKERLRYLTDAAGAASVVRFPVVGRGGAPGMKVKQIAPGYDQGIKRPQASQDEINLGTFLSGGVATVKVTDLTRHGLIVGFTGSGKTNTCLHVLGQLWREHHIPVLVIEPAKTEYRGLVEHPGFESMLIFTLGDEAVSPFRLNPFEILPGVRVETHISALKTCFDAALPQFGVLPTIVEEAIMRIYRDKGWQLTDQGKPAEERLFPTMRDMYAAVIRVTEARGYSGEVRDNIRAAAAGRIGSLLAGSKGYMFGCQRSIPMEVLLRGPVVLELDALSDNEKALAMMFLLTQMREYCKVTRRDSTLTHVTLIEEAHRVLENVRSMAGSEVASDTRAEAVRFFSGALAEIRAYGEGFLIAEQSPEKLAPDAVRNTNLKIAHMLLDEHDRQSIAGAMIMDEEQKLFLGKLPVGQAAIFMPGYEKATFMRVPPVKGQGYAERLGDEVVTHYMQRFQQQYSAAYLPFAGCRFCGTPCRHRLTIEPVTLDKTLHVEFQTALHVFDEHPEPAYDSQNWQKVVRVCANAASHAGLAGQLDAAYCYFTHEIDFPFTQFMRDQFVNAFHLVRR